MTKEYSNEENTVRMVTSGIPYKNTQTTSSSLEERVRIFIPYSVLPEAEMWRTGGSYRIKSVLRQTRSDEEGAEFEIVDATYLDQ